MPRCNYSRLAFGGTFSVGALLLVLGTEPIGAQPTGIRVLVGPNIRISRDGYANAEPFVAADPRDPKRLLSGAFLVRGLDGYPASRVYASNDGGYTWIGADIPADK